MIVVDVAPVTVNGNPAMVAVTPLAKFAPLMVTVTPAQVGGGGGRVMLTVAAPLFVVSCVDVAMTEALAALPEGVSTPDEDIEPSLEVHETVFEKAPVPVTVAAQTLVCVGVIDDGTHETETPVIVGGGGVTTAVW